MRADGNPVDYLAAERTFLAWVRTGLAMMAIGFGAAKLSRQTGKSWVLVATPHRCSSPHVMLGTQVVCALSASLLCSVAGTLRYYVVLHELQEAQYEADAWGPLFVSIGLGALAGLFMAYLAVTQCSKLCQDEMPPDRVPAVCSCWVSILITAVWSQTLQDDFLAALTVGVGIAATTV